jgi:hypothetical protein
MDAARMNAGELDGLFQALFESDSSALGVKKLVTWRDADAAIELIGEQIRLDYERECIADNTYHSWLLWQLAKRWEGIFTLEARKHLVKLLYRQDKPSNGSKPIDARNWKPEWTSDGGVEVGWHGGHMAVKLPRGRPRMGPQAKRAARLKAWRKYNAKHSKGKWKWKHHVEAPKVPPRKEPNPRSGSTPHNDKRLADYVEAFTDKFKDAVMDELKERAQNILKGGSAASDVQRLQDSAEGNFNRF